MLYQPVFDLTTGDVVKLQTGWRAGPTGRPGPEDSADAISWLDELIADIGGPLPSLLGLTLCIDLPTRLLGTPGLMDRLLSLNEQVRRRLWCLEVGFTETQWLAFGQEPPQILARLRERGIGLAIHPLVGHAHLWAMLREVPVNAVSISARSRWNRSFPGHFGRDLSVRARELAFEVRVHDIDRPRLGRKAVHNGYRLGRGLALREASGWAWDLFNKQTTDHPIVQ